MTSNNYDDAYAAAVARFQTSTSGKPPTEQQKDDVKTLQVNLTELAAFVIAYVPEGRNKSIALTLLEDFHMRANRAIFVDKKDS